MNTHQATLLTVLLLAGALPIWMCLGFVVPQSTGWGGSPIQFVIAPVVLVGITAAVHRLINRFRDAWAISAVAAAVIALGALSIVSWLSR